jgi:tetratricopeptide (TPR) repeat protein
MRPTFLSNNIKTGYTMYLKSILLPFLMLCLAAGSVQSQTFRAYMNAADESYNKGDYYSAFNYYGIAVEIEPKRTDVIYKLAESARMFEAYALADSAYQRVLGMPDYTDYPMALYWSANMKKSLGQYDAARDQFLQFAAQMDTASPEYAAKAHEQAEHCDWAIARTAAPMVGVDVLPAPGGINTPYSEYGAIQRDDNSLFYTSFSFIDKKDTHNPPRPYMKVLESVGGGPGILYDALNDDKLHTAYLSFNADRTRVYYTLCEYVGVADVICKIYSRPILDDNLLGAPEKLPAPVNMDGYTNTQPAPARDAISGEERLYFASNRPGGKGGMDIWYVVIKEDGTCGELVNVEALNTAEDDMTPFYHEGSQTLYFSSNGRKGLGGLDIYYAARLGSGWAEVQHMGYPINSSYNDVHYSLNELGNEGYFASNRESAQTFEPTSEFCCFDIYRVQTTALPIKVFVFDARTLEPLPGAKVELSEIVAGNPILQRTESDPNGHEYTFNPDIGRNYRIRGSKPGYLPELYELDLSVGLVDAPTEVNLYLKPAYVDLVALTFDSLPGGNDPLAGATVQLFEGGDQVDMQTNELTNRFEFRLDANKTYTIIASKPNYHSDTLVIDLRTMDNPFEVEARLTLLLKGLIEIPPLYLYFDNDQPNPRSYAVKTSVSYGDTYEAYYARKELFTNEYTAVLEGRDRFLAEQRIKAFFDREVRDSYRALVEFSERLEKLLAQGKTIEITITGYASPRASSEYNYKLSKRRVDCVRNHFLRFNNGALTQYMRSGKLKLVEVSKGDREAPPIVSNQLKDERNSIFSPIASNERRVEIVGVIVK